MKIKKSEQVICIATLVAKEDRVDDLLKVLYELKQLSPKEAGCLRYELHQDDENPLKFTFIDRFKDAKAFEYHCAQEYTIHYFDNIIPKLVDFMEITTHKEIELQAE